MIICKDIDALILQELNVSSWIKYRALCRSIFMMMTKDELLNIYHRYILKFCKKHYPPINKTTPFSFIYCKDYIDYASDLCRNSKFKQKIDRVQNFQIYLINILNKNKHKKKYTNHIKSVQIKLNRRHCKYESNKYCKNISVMRNTRKIKFY